MVTQHPEGHPCAQAAHGHEPVLVSRDDGLTVSGEGKGPECSRVRAHLELYGRARDAEDPQSPVAVARCHVLLFWASARRGAPSQAEAALAEHLELDQQLRASHAPHPHAPVITARGAVGLVGAEGHVVHLAPMATDEASAGALGPADVPERARCGAHHAHVHAVVEDRTHDGPVEGQLTLQKHGTGPGE